MGCQNCSDCDGEKDTTAKSLDLLTNFDSNDCEIDQNGPYNQNLTIDSNRATDVELRIEANPDPEIRILSSNPVTESVQAYESGVEVTFKIEKSGQGSQPQGKVELEIKFRRRNNQSWKSLTTIKPRRQIAGNP